jgi:16S rRNA G966 N2-methylase RsmD
VAGCCDPRGCDEFFSPRFARRVARRYRRKGLDRAARRMVAFLESRGVDGATVLEIGGGVGEIGLELLGRGAARALTLELSPAYDAEAARLAREAGVEGRVARRRHDIAADPAAVEPADVVVLHRVVCCYPDYERLLGAAATHAGRLLVFSHPPRNVVSRAVLGCQNLLFRALGREFRTFAHPPAAMLAVLERNGLRPVFTTRAFPWHVAGLERSGVHAPMDVVAVVGAREAAGVCGAVGVPAVDEFGGAEGAVDGGEFADEVGAGAGAGAAADFVVDGADVHGAAAGVVGDGAVDGVVAVV